MYYLYNDQYMKARIILFAARKNFLYSFIKLSSIGIYQLLTFTSRNKGKKHEIFPYPYHLLEFTYVCTIHL